MIYEACEPPAGKRCDMRGCSSPAEVRLIIPMASFEADGADHSRDLRELDLCECHWPEMRDSCLHNGHEVTDATGRLDDVARDFPAWDVFHSDGGRLYASTTVGARGLTADAALVSQLRARMRQPDD
jgi:hypothetical protein